jgi:hypothetical protein
MPVHLTITAALAAALAVAAPGAALAADAPSDAPSPGATQTVQATFGNTVISLYPDGRSQKLWLHPDGTWDGKSRKDKPLSGRWTMKGDRVCLRQVRPPTLPISFCQAMPKDPAVTLTSHDLTGQTIRLRIVKGITETGG